MKIFEFDHYKDKQYKDIPFNQMIIVAIITRLISFFSSSSSTNNNFTVIRSSYQYKTKIVSSTHILVIHLFLISISFIYQR
jgi:hypothetical protein